MTFLQSLYLHKSAVKSYLALLKFRLSFFVVLSGMFGYAFAKGNAVDFFEIFCLGIGSFLITGSANTINQIIERFSDRLMKRTEDRPLATGRISKTEASWYAGIMAVLGGGVLGYALNPLAAALSIWSLLLYAFLYTPMKQHSPVAVLIGAIPGALPPLIGHVAATGSFQLEGFLLFAIQFVWQFPHFWAIAWLADDDYRKAGIRLLPNGEKGLNTAIQIVSYTVFLIPLGLLPWYFGYSGESSTMVVTVAGLGFLVFSMRFLYESTRQTALGVMFASLVYLPIMQLAFLLDRIF